MSRSAKAAKAAKAAPLALLVALVAVAAAGCGIGPGRAPSGRTATRQLATGAVTRVDAGSAFQVRVTVGKGTTTMVTYDDNLADLLDVGVDGATLRLRLKPHATITNRPTLRAEVAVRQLQSIHASGAASVEVAGTVRTAGLRLDVSGASRVTAELASSRVDADLSGASRLTLTGTAGTLGATSSGASSLELADLRLHALDLRLSGASQADVQVDGTIAARLSGASHLSYKGAARFTRRETSEASTITRA